MRQKKERQGEREIFGLRGLIRTGDEQENYARNNKRNDVLVRSIQSFVK